MTTAKSDESMVTKLRQQDHAEFAALVKEYHRRLLGFARSTAGAELAEDVIQDV
jgi:DNA-directed RNA polymerase specialized sigma24 family protein